MKISALKTHTLDFDVYFNKAIASEEFLFRLGFGYQDCWIRLYAMGRKWQACYLDIGKLAREGMGWCVTLYNHDRYGDYIDRFLEVAEPIILRYEEETGQEIIITDQEAPPPGGGDEVEYVRGRV